MFTYQLLPLKNRICILKRDVNRFCGFFGIKTGFIANTVIRSSKNIPVEKLQSVLIDCEVIKNKCNNLAQTLQVWKEIYPDTSIKTLKQHGIFINPFTY